MVRQCLPITLGVCAVQPCTYFQHTNTVNWLHGIYAIVVRSALITKKMKEHLQVKQFADYSSDNEQIVNDFLKEIGNRVVSVTPLYNTILGGIQYVVVYWY